MPNPIEISLPRIDFKFHAKACTSVYNVMLNTADKDYSTVVASNYRSFYK